MFISSLCIGALSSPAMKKLMYPLASIKDISDNPYNPPEYPNVTFYRTQVTISIPGREDLTGDSGDYFRDIQESREKSIQDALSKLQPQQGNCVLLLLLYNYQKDTYETPKCRMVVF